MTALKYALTALALTATAPLAGEHVMELTPQWEYVADTVMGGNSTGQIARTEISGRTATQLTGDVSLENNGGFIQMAFDLDGGKPVDVSDWTGIEFDVYGNGAGYEMRLRTDELERPWQSYRAAFDTASRWQTVTLPWDAFEAQKTDVAFDPARLRRIGVLAIGAEMHADIAVSGIRFYR